MENISKGGIDLFRFNNLQKFDAIDHFITGRAGGFSKGPFTSLNTGFHVGDNDWYVLQNRKKLAAMLEVDLTGFTFASQTHSSNVALVDLCKRGKGSTESENAISNTDALITKTKGIFICVQVADCVPIILYDPVNHVAGVIHAGWRGTLRKVAEATVRMMMHNFETHPSDLVAGIGPSNGPCCYEVGEEVKNDALKSLGSIKEVIKPAEKKEKYIFDQWHANFLQLRHAGVKEENIEIAGICSQCHSDSFFSSRKDKGVTGRTTAGIMIK